MYMVRSTFVCAVITLILSNLLTSSAAPAASVSHAEQWEDSDNHAKGSWIESSSSFASKDEDLTSILAPIEEHNTNKAVVITSCQGCSADAADVHPVFDFQVVPGSVEECAVAFSLNGSTVHLSSSTPSLFLQLLSANADAYSLKTDVTCSLGKEGLVSAGPVVTVYIETVNGYKPQEITGFQVYTSPEASIAQVSLLATVASDQTHALASPSGLDSVPSGRSHVSGDLSKPVSRPSRSSHPSSDEDTAECDHYRCPLHSLLHNIRKTFKSDRFEHIKGRVQSVIIDAKNTLGCHKANTTLEKAQDLPDNRLSILSSGPVKDNNDALKKIIEQQTPLVIALEALASALGLGGLWLFLRKRCCSLRRRVERLADREERMKAREYRRAARREAWRRRWVSFKRTCTCCFGSYDCEPEDEEKQGLVSNAANHASHDELNTSMAQLEGLHYAQEIVAEMIRNKHTGIATHQGVPSSTIGYPADMGLHYPLRGNTRSRASSLPSYNSDVLPDYSSQPDSAEVARHVRVINNYRRSGSPVSSAGSSRCTPDSSIPDISPRPSQETLRTQSERY